MEIKYSTEEILDILNKLDYNILKTTHTTYDYEEYYGGKYDIKKIDLYFAYKGDCPIPETEFNTSHHRVWWGINEFYQEYRIETVFEREFKKRIIW